ncbi:hypothetical protein [uncultured Brevundimonas sp.]|uniref:phage tail assembly chaperone n=1 Tax=uncultured Brevundimonas sp. TaxID=213418 RepID=UPI0026363B2D|nr:hypothetical protein [uncultured Brevundimonas sp.]
MVWQAFLDLMGTRQVGMGVVGPITFTEIAAYNDLTLAGLGPWEVATIRKMDLAVMRKATPSKSTDAISTKDTKGVGDLLRTLKAKKEAQHG